MAKDVLITPASGLIQFKDTGGNVDATIQLTDSNVLNITGTVSLGDLAADVYIGDGVNEVDIVFEQNGVIYGQAGKTLTLGLANSYLSLAANITSGANITGNVQSSANILGANLVASANLVSVGAVVSGNITGGNLLTSGRVIATGNVQSSANITGANLVASANLVSVGAVVSGNITGGNLLTAGLLSATGNVNGGNITTAGNVTGTYLLGNVFYATGISASKIYNGTSEANIGTSGGNANISIGGTSNVVVVYSGGVAITGDLSVTGNATLSGNILGDRLQNGTTSIDIQTASGNANITVGGTSNVVVFSSAGQNVSGYLTSSGNITGGNLLTAGLVSVTGNITAVGNISGSYILGNGSQLTGIVTGNSFGVISVSGQSDVVAAQATDTLTLAAGTGIAITTDAGNDIITISSAATDSIFATGGDMGTISEAVTSSEDLGTVTSAATVEYDLGTESTSGIITPSLLLLPSYTVLQLVSLPAAPAGQFVYCSNENGGAIPAFSDGTNWRRVSDRAIVS